MSMLTCVHIQGEKGTVRPDSCQNDYKPAETDHALHFRVEVECQL